jgi:hypothetical protein
MQCPTGLAYDNNRRTCLPINTNTNNTTTTSNNNTTTNTTTTTTNNNNNNNSNVAVNKNCGTHQLYS